MPPTDPRDESAGEPRPAAAGQRAPGRARTTPEQLLELVLTTPTVEAHLEALVQLAEGLSADVAGCGVTLRRQGELLSAASSNSLVGALDEVQYTLGEGPCLSALRTGEVVAVVDAARDRRFGAYPAHALTHGLSSSYSVPLRVGGTTVAALNSYAERVDGFDAPLREELLGFGAQAEVALALVLRGAERDALVEQLHAAMQTRSTVDQALGILMARERCTNPTAFAMLRRASQARQRKLVDIAADVITATTGSPPQPGRFEA